MAILTREKQGSESQPGSAVAGDVVDQQAAEDALLARVWDYIDRNELEPEALRIADEGSPQNGTDRMTLEQINAVIRASRADRAARAAKTR